jgi:hypothetical protein
MGVIDNLANKLAREGKPSEIEGELRRIDPSTLSEDEALAWWHLYGAMAFKSGRDDVALQRFQQALAIFPNAAIIKFSLGQQYIRMNDPDKGFALFYQANFPDISSKYALAEARYAYLCSRYEAGRHFIRPLFAAYRAVKILDSTFLFLRGLSSFSEYWDYLAAFSVLSGDWKELDEVTEYAAQNFTDYNFDWLRCAREAYHDGAPDTLLARPGQDSGFERTLKAVIESRQETTLAGAKSILNAVALSSNDFTWLRDVAILGLVESAHRFHDQESEKDYLGTFLERQPLLFEPNIALRFWLLETQERLKSDLFRP